jgi:hypothetical protein
MMHLEWELGDVVRGPEDNKSFFFLRERERERERGWGGGFELDLSGHWRPSRMKKRSYEGWFSCQLTAEYKEFVLGCKLH